MEELDDKTKNEIKDSFKDLSEVEIFFVYQEIDKYLKSGSTPKLEFMLECVLEETVRFGVRRVIDKHPDSFKKWVKFWRKWQSELTIIDMKDMVDNISFNLKYDQYLPTTKWKKK